MPEERLVVRMNIWKPRTQITAFGLLLTSGCVGGEPSSDSVALPATLRDVDVQQGFRFEATRQVEIHLETSLPHSGGALIVRRTSGDVIFRGSLPVSGSLVLRYPLPRHEEEFDVTFGPADDPRSLRLVVGSDGIAKGAM